MAQPSGSIFFINWIVQYIRLKVRKFDCIVKLIISQKYIILDLIVFNINKKKTKRGVRIWSMFCFFFFLFFWSTLKIFFSIKNFILIENKSGHKITKTSDKYNCKVTSIINNGILYNKQNWKCTVIYKL